MLEHSKQELELIEIETKRLSERYNKSFLDCKDIKEITGLGRDSVRAMINSKPMKAKKVGRKKIVSIINFVHWQFSQQEVK